MNLLFCTGVPKSGTTFLQMILNAHPEVSCPSEHQFDHFRKSLSKLFTDYNYLLRGVDGQTANQGACTFRNEDANEVFRLIVRLAAIRGAQGRDVRWHGLNDNQILYDPAIYFSFFPDARFICIVRDPRAIAVSSWHHNLRVEPGFEARAKNPDHWANMLGNRWQRDMNRLRKLEETGDGIAERLHYCRYEDLAVYDRPTLCALFGFLDLEASEAAIEAIAEATNFDKFRGDPFFRAGRAEGWREELSKKAVKNVEAKAAEGMQRFGYLT
jgi:hypothetical protein